MNIIIRNICVARCILYCNLFYKICAVANCSWQIETETPYYNIIVVRINEREREREREIIEYDMR